MTNFTNQRGYANGSPTQEDSLTLDYSSYSGYYYNFVNQVNYALNPTGIHLEAGVVIDQATGQTILNYSNIDLFNITGTRGNDILIGGDYDHNAGNPGNPYDDDQLYGGDGDDRLEGRGGDDRLSGGNGNDILIGGAGKDELFGDAGDDIIYGGSGDNIRDDIGINRIYANEATWVVGGTQTTLYADYSGAEYSVNPQLVTTITIIEGIYYEDVTLPRRGITVGTINGQASIDNGIGGTLNFDGGMAFNIKGSQLDDVIGDGFVLSNDDDISGYGGNDIINAGGGNDYLDGGSGNDTLSGSAGADIIFGGSGNDTLIGGSGADILSGGDGDDTIIDTDGYINGSAGFDTLVADYTNLSYNGAGINFGPSGSTQFSYFSNIESFNIKGTKFADTLTGGIYNDMLDGGLGDDTIDGGQGNDILVSSYGTSVAPETVNGGEGDDMIYAVAGIEGAHKVISGGDGADRFFLNVRGELILGLDFNTDLLAKFINDITLPEYPSTDWQQIGIELAFEGAGAILGAVPVVGGILSFGVEAAQTGYGSYQETQKIMEQINTQVAKATQAAKDYEGAEWGKINSQGVRDTVIIEDFKIGIDSILLPTLKENESYQIIAATNNKNESGVLVSLNRPDGNQGNSPENTIDVVFIVNNYRSNIDGQTTKQYTPSEFEGQIRDLLYGIGIGTYANTPKIGNNTADTVNEVLEGTFANDIIDGMGGPDEIFGYYGNDVLNGGEGNDIIHGGSNGNTAYLQYDRTFNSSGAYLNDGNDIIGGGAGDDTLYGESGDDFINGDAFTRSASGASVAEGNGNDTLYGDSGNDTLMGGAGNDMLVGGTGADKMDGGLGDDTYIVDNKADTVSEGEGKAGGTDTVNSSVSFTLTASVENLALTGTNVINGTGNYLDNSLDGNDAANTLYGLDGNDNLVGNGGNDRLEGGYGTDKLNGGVGNDLLIGGLGHDQFVFGAALGLQNFDRIQDFRVTEDIIDLSKGIFTQFTTTGAIAEANFVSGAGAVAHDSNDYLIYNTSNGVLSYDANGNAAGQFIDIAVIGVSNLTYTAFAIV
ncbi:MAG: calcium-binding protein [Methylovulum miyakonense]|uniref:calcium-binding protein n=1 Tax=Methylovulum miyakonense TaxID=645578 RepID=UPI003BB61E99